MVTVETASLRATAHFQHDLIAGVIVEVSALLESGLQFIPCSVRLPVFPDGDEAIHLAALPVEEEHLQVVPLPNLYGITLQHVRRTLYLLNGGFIPFHPVAELVVLQDLFEAGVEVFDEQSDLHSIIITYIPEYNRMVTSRRCA